MDPSSKSIQALEEGLARYPLGFEVEVIPLMPLALDRMNDIIDSIAREKEIYIAQARETGKPDNVIEKIIEGKMGKFIKESCLMNQPYVRNPDITIADLLNELIAKIGENISIKRFVRYQIGDA